MSEQSFNKPDFQLKVHTMTYCDSKGRTEHFILLTPHMTHCIDCIRICSLISIVGHQIPMFVYMYWEFSFLVILIFFYFYTQ